MFVKEELTDVEDDFQGTRQAAKRRQSFRFCRPCGAGTYMHTHTQRLRAGAMFSRRFAAWATARFQNFPVSYEFHCRIARTETRELVCSASMSKTAPEL